MSGEQTIKERVGGALAQIESERKVRVLFACESGSRAWGFPSQDSDYDVRFVYVHRHDWYLSVEDRRDVIECPITEDLDLSGWELRKALRLLRKSNPPLFEWLKSPIVYRHDPGFAVEFGTLAAIYYSPERCFMHYLHMAYGIWRDHLREREMVSPKKYLYAIRALLACRWIERTGEQVPMLFERLVHGVLEDRKVCEALRELIKRKQAGRERGVQLMDPCLSFFIEKELGRLQPIGLAKEACGDAEQLNGFFRRYAY